MSKKRKNKATQPSTGTTAASREREEAVNPLRGFQFDPTSLAYQFQGAYQRPSQSLNFGTLREMARVCQPVASVILTRQNQVARFARRPRFDGDVGIEIRMKDPDAKPTKADRKKMQELTEFFLKCGKGPVAPGDAPRDDFDAFLRKIVRDSLTLDAAAVELRPDRKGVLYDFHALDAATIFFAVPSYQAGQAHGQNYASAFGGGVGMGFGGVQQPTNAEIAFIQQLQNQTLAEFTAEELAYWIRNPRTDLHANGYGFGELEQLIETVTGFLNAMSYNSKYFTHGNIPEGVLSLVGQYQEEDVEDFIRYWNAMVSGVANAGRIPVMAFKDGKGINWTPVKTNNREMQYHEWIDFLVTITCAVYQIDREEIGFGSKGVGEPGGLGEGGNDGALQHSLSKGLYPLLQRLGNGINTSIMPQIEDAEEFEFAWAGVDPSQEDKKVERAEKFINAGLKTPNEARAEFDMKPVGEEKLWGDAPANATLFQAWQMGKQAELQAAGMDPDADPNADPDADPDQQDTRLPKVNEDGTEEDDE